jgi:hypothetical protein
MSSKRVFLSVVLILALFMANNTGLAQGTAFTYQGNLSDGGRPANGSYDLQFTIYDSATNGTNVSVTITNLATGVSNGLFTLNLDFGNGIFSGPARWLEIGVRSNGNTGSFAVLAPRQALAPSPYAITAATVSGAVPASQLTGTLASPLLGGVYTGAVLFSNAANSFVGDASGVTNVQASKLTGAVQIPNGGTGQTTASAALSALGGFSLSSNNNVTGQVETFSNLNTLTFPGFAYSVTPNGTNLYMSNFVLLRFGTGGSVYNNPGHGPADEVQFTFGSRVAILPGYGQQHSGAIQMGSGTFGGAQGADCPLYFTEDSGATANNLLGYGSMVDYESSFWNGAGNLERYRTRVETEDTNGALRLNSYFFTAGGEGYLNPLIGQSPGTKGPIELWAGPATDPNVVGVVEHGRKTVDSVYVVQGSSNFGVDWDSTPIQDIALTQNINLTNVPSKWTRTNQSDAKTIRLFPGSLSFSISTPANWIWSGVAPTTVAPSNVLRIKVEQDINSGGTWYFAESDNFSYTPLTDPNAQAFATSAGITNVVQNLAVQEFVLNAKMHGYWPQLVAAYPFAGGSSNSESWNLVATNLYRIGWTGVGGGISFTNGVKGDGTNYGVCSNLVINASVFTNAGYVGAGCWVSTTNSPLANGVFFNAYGGGSLFQIAMNGPLYIYVLGPDGSGGGTLGPSSGTNYSGFLALNCINNVSQTYVNSVIAGGTSSQAGTYTDGTFGWFNNSLNGPNQNITYTFGVVWQGMTPAQMSLMINDIASFESTLGR